MGESVWSWSTTAASNANADSAIGWAEGQAPGGVNDSARSMMAALAKFVADQSGGLTSAGSANAYTLTTNQGLPALAAGRVVVFKANFTNTGASTLNVDATGAKAIRRQTGAADQALVGGEIQSGGLYACRYDPAANSAAGAWILIDPSFGPGTAGGIWTTDGTNPSWRTDLKPWTVLSDQTVSGTPTYVSFENLLTDAYANYAAWFMAMPGTNDVSLYMQFGTGSTPTWVTSGYTWGSRISGPGGGADGGSTVDSVTTALALNRVGGGGNSVSNAAGIGGRVEIPFPRLSGFPRRAGWATTPVYPSASGLGVNGGGIAGMSTELTSVRFFWSSGNHANGGRFILYGW